jgi:hypothetical protein
MHSSASSPHMSVSNISASTLKSINEAKMAHEVSKESFFFFEIVFCYRIDNDFLIEFKILRTVRIERRERKLCAGT